MKSKYELHPELMNNSYPLNIRCDKQAHDGYLHWHENLELLYFIDGACKVINGDDEMAVKAGDIVVINSEVLHYVKAKDNPCRYILLQLDAAYFEMMGFRISGARIRKMIDDEQLREILWEALSEQEKKMPYYHESVKALMLQLLVIVFRKYLAEDILNHDHSHKSKLIKQVVEYINGHYQEDLTVESISEACGYSRFYISKTFKEVSGVTVTRYINAIRIERAKVLMKNGNASLSEIAIQCGFMNLSYFSKVFKRIENVAPYEYRTKLKETQMHTA